MESKKILYVSQEIHPYLPENEISKPSLELPKKMNDKGHQVRVFMPRYGLINERRHQLHEVIRLSGMNIIVNDMDQPLIIKVASVPQARMQVYFIDNQEYFKRKATFHNDKGEFFDDNDQRAIFFCRGVIETVKKLGWTPDIIHCHGWLASFLPLYLRKFHHDNPLFENSKIVFSVYDCKDCDMPETLQENLKFDGINGQDIKRYAKPSLKDLYLNAAHYSDAVIAGSENLDDEMKEKLRSSVEHFLEYPGDDSAAKVQDFYAELVGEVEEEPVA